LVGGKFLVKVLQFFNPSSDFEATVVEEGFQVSKHGGGFSAVKGLIQSADFLQGEAEIFQPADKKQPFQSVWTKHPTTTSTTVVRLQEPLFAVIANRAASHASLLGKGADIEESRGGAHRASLLQNASLRQLLGTNSL
jgi:hypothetical protein